MDEMMNFAVLFMPRTTENIQKYILRRHRVGGNAKRYAEFSRIQNSYTRITRHFLWMHWEKMS